MVRDPRADKGLVVAVIIAVLTVSQPWKDTQAQQNTLPPWAEFGISVAVDRLAWSAAVLRFLSSASKLTFTCPRRRS
jgi:hypothetical protein